MWFEPGLAMADGLAQLRAADAIILAAWRPFHAGELPLRLSLISATTTHPAW